MSELTPANANAPVRSLPGASGAVPGATPEGPTLRGYLGAVRRNLWMVVLLGAIGVGLSALAVYRNDPVFASNTVVQFPEDRSGAAGGLAGLAASITGGGGSMASQAQVMRSRLLLGGVVDSLGLRLHREIAAFPRDQYRPVGWIRDGRVAPAIEGGVIDLEFLDDRVRARFEERVVETEYGRPVDFPGLSFVVPAPPPVEELRLHIVSRDGAIDAVLDEMRVFVREGTNLVDIVVTGYDPIITQRTANTAAEHYRQFTSARTREQAERRREFVFEQLETTEELLTQTQDELTTFRQREGLYSSRTQAMMDQTGRAELELMEAELQAERQVYTSLLERLRESDGEVTTEVLRAIVSSPSTIGNPAMMGAYETLSQYQMARDSMVSGRFSLSADNPDVERIDSLIASSQENLLALTRGNIEAIDARLAGVRTVRGRIEETFQHLATAEPEEVRLMMRIEAIGEATAELRQQFYTAGMAEAGLVDQVTILDEALPGRPAGSGPMRMIALGLIFGVMIGAAGAIALDSTNRSIRRRDEVERVLRVPELGMIPRIPKEVGARQRLKLPARIWPGNGVPANGAARADLVTATEVHSPAAEAYRTLRTNLVGSNSFRTPRSLMVTSPSGAEGKTTTAANLAVTFAHQGRRVLLMDCDLRRPRLHSVLGVTREPGLADVLAGSIDLPEAIRPTDVDGLSILTAGAVPPLSAADLLSGDVVRKLLQSVEADYEVVIVDSPPVLMTADAPILATQVDGVLVILRAGQTDRETAQYAIHQLGAVGAKVLGAVLNDPDATLEGQVGAYGPAAYAGVR